jgi:hypothetical protein
MVSFAPVGAVVISKKRRQLINKFRETGTTSAATARTLADLDLPNNVIFEIQKLTGVIVPAGGDRFYLDEERERSFSRLRLSLVITAFLLGIFLIVFRHTLFGS